MSIGRIGIIIDAENYISNCIYRSNETMCKRDFEKLIDDTKEKSLPALEAILRKKRGCLNGPLITLCRIITVTIDSNSESDLYNEDFVEACMMHCKLELQVPEDIANIRKFSPNEILNAKRVLAGKLTIKDFLSDPAAKSSTVPVSELGMFADERGSTAALRGETPDPMIGQEGEQTDFQSANALR